MNRSAACPRVAASAVGGRALHLGLSDACACAQGTEDAKDSAAHTRLASEDFEHVELAAAVAEAVRNAEAALWCRVYVWTTRGSLKALCMIRPPIPRHRTKAAFPPRGAKISSHAVQRVCNSPLSDHACLLSPRCRTHTSRRTGSPDSTGSRSQSRRGVEAVTRTPGLHPRTRCDPPPCTAVRIGCPLHKRADCRVICYLLSVRYRQDAGDTSRQLFRGGAMAGATDTRFNDGTSTCASTCAGGSPNSCARNCHGFSKRAGGAGLAGQQPADFQPSLRALLACGVWDRKVDRWAGNLARDFRPTSG